MPPNLLVYAQTAVNPNRWFSRSKSSSDISATPGASLALTEHWTRPIPGTYQHRPGAGWFLIKLDSDPSKPDFPQRVIWSDALDAKILEHDYHARSKQARLPEAITPSSNGSRNGSVSRPASPNELLVKLGKIKDGKKPKERPMVNFVRLTDEVTWLNDKDANGNPTKAPWQRFCIDKDTGEFRPMLRRDDPAKASRPTSRASNVGGTHSTAPSVRSNVSGMSGPASRSGSRPGSRAVSPAPGHRCLPSNLAVTPAAGTPSVTPARGPSPLGSPQLAHGSEDDSKTG